MPWVAAAEMNRVLRMGGLVYHVAPQCAPVHEQPNDFWRFTDEGFKILFGRLHGFEIVHAGLADRMRVYPEDDRTSPELGTPFSYGYATAYVVARKIAEIDTLHADADALADRSARYPVRNVSTRDTHPT
jgi:hypothetical protein